jgi:UDP-N-acetylmuramoyl-L-alanyl-D-glutamate--2,6-diaminopimelate ligase
MYALLQFLRRLAPKPVLDLYHRALSWLAAARYDDPSEKLIVIGVTGTSGKTTTSYLIAKMLEASGAKTGMITTAMFKVADKTWENKTKMTMLGRFQLQKMLREMVDAGCTYAIVETTSQGIVQHRHRHIAYDIVMLTNLWPEHVEAHGGFENYKKAKKALFEYTAHLPRKILKGTQIQRVEILNGGSEHAHDFVVKGFDKVMLFGAHQFKADQVVYHADHSTFTVDGTPVDLHLPGAVNVENALAAIAVADAVGMTKPEAADALSAINGLPGRYERINEGQPFTVIVDFAFEPGALGKLYEMVKTLPHERIIHVVGSAGGGRDIRRRPVMGKIAGTNADVVIITNEDPYDDNPRQIMEDIRVGVMHGTPKSGKPDEPLMIEDRREAIRKAVSLAKAGDIVLITGKGSEPVMAVAGGRKIPWSDAEEARQALRVLHSAP